MISFINKYTCTDTYKKQMYVHVPVYLFPHIACSHTHVQVTLYRLQSEYNYRFVIQTS